jgi:hypothetical protein
VGSSVKQPRHLQIKSFDVRPLELQRAMAMIMQASKETPMEFLPSLYFFSTRLCSIPGTQPPSFMLC